MVNLAAQLVGWGELGIFQGEFPDSKCLIRSVDSGDNNLSMDSIWLWAKLTIDVHRGE